MNIVEKYKNIPYHSRTCCEICSKPLEEPLIKLPEFPLTEVFIPFHNSEKTGVLDQEFYICPRCGLGQLKNIIPPDFLYSDQYNTRSSTSSSAVGAIHYFVDFINELFPDRNYNGIFDIGCNDGYMIKLFHDRCINLFGNDPIITSHVEDYRDSKLTLIGDFFENIDFDSLPVQPDCFICSHTLEHIAKPLEFISKVLRAGTDDAVFFFQFPGLEGLIRDAHFDQIFHQHYNYFSIKSIRYLLDELDAELISYRYNPYHWNSLMIAFRKRSVSKTGQIKVQDKGDWFPDEGVILSQYDLFKKSMFITSNRINNSNDVPVYGFGAALMLPVLDYHLEKGLSKLNYIIDDDINKIGKYYINLPLKIISTQMVSGLNNAIIVLTAINSMDAGRKIIPRLIGFNPKQIILPLNII